MFKIYISMVVLCWCIPVKTGRLIWVSKSCFVGTYIASSSGIVGVRGFLKVALFGSSTVSFFGFRTLQYAVSGNHFTPPALLLLSFFFGFGFFSLPTGIFFSNALSRRSTKAPFFLREAVLYFSIPISYL